jgi:hypothetical protein
MRQNSLFNILILSDEKTTTCIITEQGRQRLPICVHTSQPSPHCGFHGNQRVYIFPDKTHEIHEFETHMETAIVLDRHETAGGWRTTP